MGEIGLDYWDKAARKDEGVRERQREIYTEQLQMAKEQDLPTSVHGRGSWQNALDLAVAHGPERIIFHWYSGPLDVLDSLLDRGYYTQATSDMPLISGGELLVYVKGPHNIHMDDIGTTVALSVTTNNAQYITECNVKSASSQ